MRNWPWAAAARGTSASRAIDADHTSDQHTRDPGCRTLATVIIMGSLALLDARGFCRCQRRRRLWRTPMPGGLFVRVGQLDHRGLAVRPPEEVDPDGQSLRSEAGRNDHRGGIDQERVQVGRALLI